MKAIILAMMIIICAVSVLATTDSLEYVSIVDYESNALLADSASKLSWVIPAVLVVICLVMAMLDFGAVGVTLASIISLVALVWLKVIYVDAVSIVSFVVIGLIFVYKLSG